MGLKRKGAFLATATLSIVLSLGAQSAFAVGESGPSSQPTSFDVSVSSKTASGSSSSESDVSTGVSTRAVNVNKNKAGAEAVRCSGSYDNPHASTSSFRTRINAHLTVKCTGLVAGKTRVTVHSQMRDSKGRRGAWYYRSGNGSAKTGGDLACTNDRRMYQAVGVVYLYYPAGLVKRFEVIELVSKAYYAKRVNGKCVIG